MLVHLPIIMATLSPVAISDTLPKFDIAKECRFEGESSTAFERCSREETDALSRLQEERPQFAGADRSSCFAEATVGGFASYVDLLTCLEMARDVRNVKANAGGSPAAQPTPPAPPEMSVVEQQ